MPKSNSVTVLTGNDHRLWRALLGVTVSVLLLFGFSYWLIVSAAHKLKADTEITKITRHQKTLTQEIINSIAADNLTGVLIGPPLSDLMGNFVTAQAELLKPNGSDDIKKNLSAEYYNLGVGYDNFFHQLNKNIANDSSSDFVDLLKAGSFYIQNLDNFNAKLSDYSDREVKGFRLRETFVISLAAGLFILEIVFVFAPAIKKIEKQSSALNEIAFTQAHIVRHPLTNIQGLLNLIAELKTENIELKQLTELAKKEADHLDSVIKMNVYKSDKTA